MGRGQKDRTTIRNEKVRPAADLVERDFSAPGPESTVGSGHYRHPDWLRIPLSGWAVKTHPRTRLVLDALEMALWQKHPQSVIHHSDQGTQYTSFALDQRCRRAGIRLPWNRLGTDSPKPCVGASLPRRSVSCWTATGFPTPTQSQSALFGFLEGFYHPHRLHSSLGYHSPVEFERRYATLPTIPN